MLRSAARDSPAAVHVAVIAPLGYMCFCAMFSLFRLGMFSFYSLVPGGTDSFSLLLNASLTCRFAAPLSLNFLMMVPSVRELAAAHGTGGQNTVFHEKLADNIPAFANAFNAALARARCTARPPWKGCWDGVLVILYTQRSSGSSARRTTTTATRTSPTGAAVDRERAEMASAGGGGGTSARVSLLHRPGKASRLGRDGPSTGRAEDPDDVESRGLLTRRGGARSDDAESRAER